MSIWPWSELISLYYNNFQLKIKKKIKILELGCGAGANIPFFTKLNADYYGIDGSKTIINLLKKKYPKLKKKLFVADFTKNIPIDKKFDLIIDRASITCNKKSSIIKSITNLRKKLNNKGLFFGIDWYSSSSTDFKKGLIDEDKNTKKNMKNSIFSNAGSFHFASKKMMINYFKKFKIISLNHKIDVNEKGRKHQLATWTIVAEKKVEKKFCNCRCRNYWSG